MLAFDHNLWGISNKHPHGISFQAAFDLEYESDLEIQEKIITDGLRLFKDLHGYEATFFVPPNGPFNNSLERAAAESGIKYMSASKIQREALGNGLYKKSSALAWVRKINTANAI